MAEDTPKSESSKEVRIRTKPPLKLCFCTKVDLGSSNVEPFRPRGYVHYVTRKFYAPDYAYECSEETYQKVKKNYENEPRKRYGYPLLESHSYGWHWDIKLLDSDSLYDKRLNFPKKKNSVLGQHFFKQIL